MEYNKELLKAIPEFQDKENIKEWTNRVDKILSAAGLTSLDKDNKTDSIAYTACLTKLSGDARKIADRVDFSWVQLRNILVRDLGQNSEENALEDQRDGKTEQISQLR
eukprot:TRINITY_DN2867_c0_g1_i10.p1 TRINITY_DN2867_c0_g1~~TRINITY_DN2867_c0_g1_i10.p1  ORF type:complete len:108 (-),score=13.12 TRINITY_DN2867_c0_g1_i10:429-752(-)